MTVRCECGNPATCVENHPTWASYCCDACCDHAVGCKAIEASKTVEGGSCQKCGSVAGWNGPEYVAGYWVGGFSDEGGGFSVGDRLKFACRTCGFERTEQTKDAKEKKSRSEARLALQHAERERAYREAAKVQWWRRWWVRLESR